MRRNRSGLRGTLNATVSKVDNLIVGNPPMGGGFLRSNLVWLPSARKRENWSRGPIVDDFCAGTHGCRPRVDLRPCLGVRNFGSYCILTSWVFGPGSAHLDLRLSVWLFSAGRMVLRFFVGSHGTLVAASSPLLMPLRDSGHSNECSLYVL